MSYDVNNIITLNTRISPQGLSFANFAEAVLFVPASELPNGFAVDTRRTYNSPSSLASDFATTTQAYIAGNKWLGGIPSTNKLTVWGVNASDATIDVTLVKARNQFWWYWTLLTAPVYAVEAQVLLAASWCNTNESFFVNCQTAAAATAIRNPAITNDIATQLTTLGYRTTYTHAHATDPYAGIALAKYFAAVNYSAVSSTITGEFKVLSGVPGEELTDTEYNAMRLATKKCVFYTMIDLQGSVDAGRTINTFTHSAFGEYIDDVVNLSAFTNNLKVTAYNVPANSTTKVGQDIVGQSLLIGSLRAVCEQYISNKYLGPRNYLDPDDAVNKFTAGYEILTKPEDILDINDSTRNERKSAPIRVRIFRRGAIHAVDISVDVY